VPGKPRSAPDRQHEGRAAEVVLGVDTHKGAHVAAVLSALGELLASGRFRVPPVGYRGLMRGSPPRRRAVASVFVWAVEALEQYRTEVRPQYGCSAHPAVWLTERGGRISTRQIDDRFAFYRAAAGLPAELSVHCLRHSYVSHLIEDGVDPLFVQQQVGHSWASTTATYTTVGGDARDRMLRRALAVVGAGQDGSGGVG
jgi:integrase/recombinase XerC